MERASTPRVLAQHLDSMIGTNVMVIGRVVQLRGDQVTIDADGNVIATLMNRDSQLVSGNGAQIIGKVTPDLTIKAMSSLDLGPDVDYSINKAVVEVTHQFPNLFIHQGQQ